MISPVDRPERQTPPSEKSISLDRTRIFGRAGDYNATAAGSSACKRMMRYDAGRGATTTTVSRGLAARSRSRKACDYAGRAHPASLSPPGIAAQCGARYQGVERLLAILLLASSWGQPLANRRNRYPTRPRNPGSVVRPKRSSDSPPRWPGTGSQAGWHRGQRGSRLASMRRGRRLRLPQAHGGGSTRDRRGRETVSGDIWPSTWPPVANRMIFVMPSSFSRTRPGLGLAWLACVIFARSRRNARPDPNRVILTGENPFNPPSAVQTSGRSILPPMRASGASLPARRGPGHVLYLNRRADREPLAHLTPTTLRWRVGCKSTVQGHAQPRNGRHTVDPG